MSCQDSGAFPKPIGSADDTTAVVDLLIWLMLCGYLYIDSISGSMMTGVGGQAPLSQAWKTTIFGLIVLSTSRRSLIACSFLLCALLAMLSGPMARLAETAELATFIREVGTALKSLLPLAVIIWCREQARLDPDFLQRWSYRVLWASLLAVLFNIALGVAGFGYHNYRSPGDSSIGVSGFFYAGNELGSLYVVTSGFLMIEAWKRGSFFYLTVLAVLIPCAFLIATKSAILSILILAFLLPIFYQRYRWRHMRMSVFAGLLAGLAAATLAVARVRDVLAGSGLLERLEYIYAKQGWMGILLSSRDRFLAHVWETLSAQADLRDIILGIGPDFLNRFGVKDSVEMDPFDLYIWFGIPGVLYFTTLGAIFLYIGMRGYADKRNQTGPGVLVTNCILLLISILAGHVIVGSLAGIAWAVLNGRAMVNVSASPFPGFRRTE